MIFTEPRFLWFFLVVFAVYWATPRPSARKLWLLAASYTFYGAWNKKFLLLILFSTVVDYVAGRALAAEKPQSIRKRWLLLSLGTNLGLLGVFKYYDFFISEGAQLLSWMGLAVEPRLLEVILPAGISFYTFQTLSYTIDVYRRKMQPTRSLLDFALFVGFFPQLVAGPIVRAIDFLPQLASKRRFADVAVRAQLVLFMVGFIKKAVVSDSVAPVVEQIFASPEAYGFGAKWLGALLYTVQIYCDFSGYSDMAIASAGLLGYELTLNFDFPYLARSITSFWRRWHISLSSWFRDYLYIPLGGNRGTSRQTLRNLLLVFLLCGLWHGARWTFILWGLYHGAFLVFERLSWGQTLKRLPRAVAHLYALLVAVGGWVLFRSDNLPAAGRFLRGMVPGGSDVAALSTPHQGLWWAGLGGFALVHVSMSRDWLTPRVQGLSDWAFAGLYGLALALIAPWIATDFQPFIYFQF
ncbi:MAG: alginate O-acetyltransferase complex protein AlgI [Pseudohongiellaceae bacterium]|jgi:alginate O-acetyltransferase complex protein AlgI